MILYEKLEIIFKKLKLLFYLIILKHFLNRNIINLIHRIKIVSNIIPSNITIDISIISSILILKKSLISSSNIRRIITSIIEVKSKINDIFVLNKILQNDEVGFSFSEGVLFLENCTSSLFSWSCCR
ncbi:hypothetical protein A0H76_879 [Hepatospora eriocheir]|uniref:Uncharacterized protein n=1 Tax=Hepatospora eriocheir TaxID=1081669 RepID=A0A1X0QLN1_9MICR|nr:hypothetical protein A0H76_879 [Hepatospora eriocheir]